MVLKWIPATSAEVEIIGDVACLVVAHRFPSLAFHHSYVYVCMALLNNGNHTVTSNGGNRRITHDTRCNMWPHGNGNITIQWFYSNQFIAKQLHYETLWYLSNWRKQNFKHRNIVHQNFVCPLDVVKLKWVETRDLIGACLSFQFFSPLSVIIPPSASPWAN